MSFEIKRHCVTQFNASSMDILAERNYGVGDIALDNPSDYTAVVESATIDLGMAILDPTPAYEIMIFCELKEGTPTPPPPGLVYGPNYFKFPGQLTSVKQFVHWLQDVLIKNPQPVNLGLFELNNEDFFSYGLPQAEYDAYFGSGNFIVYFNRQLKPILDGHVSEGNPIEAAGQLFYPLIPHIGGFTSSVDTMFRLNKIQSFLIKTTLPVTKTGVLDAELNAVTHHSILSTIEMNTMQYNLRTKADWKYIPSVYRHTTMNQPDMVQQYDLYIEILYNNSKRLRLLLAPDEKMVVNVAFYPRVSVDY